MYMTMTSQSEETPDESLIGIPSNSIEAVVRTMVDLTIRVDTQGRVLSVVDTEPATLAFSEEELTGESVGAVLAMNGAHSGAVDVTDPVAFERALLDGETESVTVPVQSSDGGFVGVSFRTVAPETGSGQICLGHEVGLTDPAGPAGILDMVPDPLYLLDSSGHIREVNGALVEYTGYTEAELRGRKMADLLPATADTESQPNPRTDDSEPQEATTFEATLVTKGGTQIRTEANVTTVTDAAGDDAVTVGVLREIQERKRRAENRDLLKQVMTRVFRHNVRNELMITKSHSDLIDDQAAADVGAHTEKIRNAADRLLGHSEKVRLIEQVLDGDGMSEIDLTDVVSTVVDRVRQASPEAKVDVALPATAVVEADPQIDRAVQEMVENAIEHAPPESEPCVDIWLDRRDDAQTLFVEDNSGGLADHEVDVLRRGSERDLEHSSGVGLWLIRWLAEQSDAEMIAHRTDDGSLMGIRFAAGDSPGDSPLTRAPGHVREPTTEQFDGNTVIGRVDALGTLEEIYDGLERTGGHSVLVTGEAGIGKTTVIEQFCDRLGDREQPPAIVTGSCERAVQPPYNAFRQVLDELPGGEDREALFRDVPESPGTGPAELGQRKQAMFADVADELRRLATDRPVVLVVEDMHWADGGTTALFEYLVEEVGAWGHRVLFVGTYRTSDVEHTHPVLKIAEETAEAGRGTVISVDSFDRAEVKKLVSQRLSIDKTPATFAGAVREHTGGTPLFVTELCRHLAESLGPVQSAEDLPDTLEPVTVPETVERAVADRLSVLPAEVRPVLRLGAVAGTEFSFDVIREASDRPVDSLIECIETLVRRDIWTRTADGIEFVHGVVREQAVARADEQTRRSLHRAVATAIETVHADALDTQAARLATHWENASESRTAFGYYRRAGQVAADAYAVDDAVANYREALSLAQSEAAVDDGELAEIYAEVASVQMKASEYERALDAVEAGLAVASETSRQQSRLLKLHISLHHKQSRLEEALALADDHLELAERVGDRDGMAKTRTNMGLVFEKRGEYDRARQQYKLALEIAEGTECPTQVGKILHNLGVVAHRQGKYEQSLEYLERSLAKIEDEFSEKAILNDLGLVAMNRGEYETASEYYERTLDIAREIHDRQGEAIAVHNLGEIAQRRGAYGRAREYFEQSLEIERELGNRHGEAVSLRYLGEVATAVGDHERAREHYEQCQEIGTELDSQEVLAGSYHGLGMLARIEGAYERASEQLADALKRRADSGETHEVAQIRLEIARVDLARGALDSARKKVERAKENLTEIGATHAVGESEQLRGTIAAHADALDQARRHWEAALGRFRRVGATQDELATLKKLVDACKEQGDTQAARTWCEEAGAAIEDAPPVTRREHEPWIDEHASVREE